jgi:regulatory protein
MAGCGNDFATAFFVYRPIGPGMCGGMAGHITSIEVQKRGPRRANVFIEGEFAFGLAMIEAAKLSKGQYLSEADIEALQERDEAERAYEYALDYLSYRPRSKAEVRRRLEQKGYSGEAVEAAAQRLDRVGLLDDEGFARYWISNREQFKPRGTYALRHELRQKGVESRLIDALLDPVDDEDNAYRAAVKRLSRWQRLDPTSRRRKMTDYLRRRGFDYGTIQHVWERLVA